MEEKTKELLLNLDLKPERKSHFVGVRMSKDEYQDLVIRSKGNVSEYVRYKLFGEKLLKDKYGEG